jgi:hypothetical protein
VRADTKPIELAWPSVPAPVTGGRMKTLLTGALLAILVMLVPGEASA